jgi:4'-phosphopantetheinyl transferase
MTETPCIWEIPSMPVVLGNNEAHIWHVDIKKTAHDLEYYRGLLSDEEREQENRYHFERDRMRYAITHGVLRLLIGVYLNIAPHKVSFNFSKRYKPALSDNANLKLCFNLSHSGNFIVYAFSMDCELGIDIETIRKMKDADGIIERFCSEREKVDYFSVPKKDRTKAFFNCWTRKEAYTKARGDGLYFPLDHFSVSLKPGDSPRLIEVADESGEKDRWDIHEIPVHDEYLGALAIENRKSILRFFQWVK